MNDAPNQLFLVAEVEGTMVGNLTFRSQARSRTQHAGEFGVSVLSYKRIGDWQSSDPIAAGLGKAFSGDPQNQPARSL